MLTAAQIQQALMILGLPTRTDVVFSYFEDSTRLRAAEIATKALQNVNATQEAKVVEILTQYSAVEYDTDIIDVEGVSINPGRLRFMLVRRLADTIGYAPDGLGQLTIERG